MSKVAHCKGCRGEVLWAISPAGKRIPIDAAPNPNGEYVIARSDVYGYRALARFDASVSDSGKPVRRFTSHFKSCPYAPCYSKARVVA